MAGFLGDMLGWADDPIYQGFDRNRQAIGQFGAGLLQGQTSQEGLAGGVHGALQGAMWDREQQQRQAALAEEQAHRSEIAAYLRQQGREDLARAIEVGFISTADAFERWYREAYGG